MKTARKSSRVTKSQTRQDVHGRALCPPDASFVHQRGCVFLGLDGQDPD